MIKKKSIYLYVSYIEFNKARVDNWKQRLLFDMSTFLTMRLRQQFVLFYTRRYCEDGTW